MLCAQVTPDPGLIARRAFDQLLAGQYAALHASFSPQMQAALSETALREKVIAPVAALGKPLRIAQPVVVKTSGADVVVINTTFAAASFDFQFSVMPDGKIGGLFMRPVQAAGEWTAPAYSRPGAFREREVTFGDPEWKLSGTLTIPAAGKLSPAVVLVHGSGPNDRDESVGGSKLFRDLAEGLASSGIAVLRYDKRTKTYGQRMAARNITLQEETVDDAVAAAAWLGGQREIDDKRVFVLGHSLGGYALPRIARRATNVAGLIVLAGSTRPLEDVIVEQTEYLGAPAATLEKMRADAERVRRIKPGAEPVLGVPASYWLDLKGYDPAREAADLRVPILVLQGERDYQVTMRDFANWKAALGQRQDVRFRSFPALNHLFIAGEGKSLPPEYQRPGHASGEVLDEIAKWINR